MERERKGKLVAKIWKGICHIFKSIGKLVGINDECTYTRVVWRWVKGIIATFVLVFCATILWVFIEDVVYCEWIRPHTSDRIYTTKHVSNRITFQEYYYRNGGRIYDEWQDKVLLDDVDWVYTSSDNDSLAVFAKDEKRGYINRFTGKVVIPARYRRAWVFSEGVAAVEKDNELLFINHAGEVVIDKDFEVAGEEPAYAFKDGYCIMQNPVTGKLGLIDRQGNWALQPEYNQIWHDYGVWKVEENGLYGLFSASMDTLFRADKTRIYLTEDVIEVRFKNHIAKRFDYEGNILVDFVIDDVENMSFETTELHNHEDGCDCVDTPIYDVANCQIYMVKSGWTEYYGLMDRNGRRVTPPDYTDIEPIAKDLYLCQPQGIIINSQGKRVE